MINFDKYCSLTYLVFFMSVGEYIADVKAHRMVGGSHPWYVFKGKECIFGAFLVLLVISIVSSSDNLLKCLMCLFNVFSSINSFRFDYYL